VSQRRLGPYVTQRLPGIRSIYTSSGHARHGRRQIPISSMWTIQNLLSMEPTTGMDLPSSSECNFTNRKKPTKSRPPASTGSRKRKGSAPHESSGSDSTRQEWRREDEGRQSDKVKTSPQIPVSPRKSIPSSKPLSAIATSTINTAASALAALAVIADSVETETALDLKYATPHHQPPEGRQCLKPYAYIICSGSYSCCITFETASPDNFDRDEEFT
jgi:hypothetical protein